MCSSDLSIDPAKLAGYSLTLHDVETALASNNSNFGAGYVEDRGERLTAAEIAWAETKRSELYHRMRTFMDRYEFFVLPSTQVPAFDVNQPYVTEIDGVAMETYIDWMKSCYYISLVGNPAISVPCGFTDDGLPVGLQIVGRHRDDWGLLQMAHAFETARSSS